MYRKSTALYIVALVCGLLINIAAFASSTFNANNTADATFAALAANAEYKNAATRLVLNVGDDGPDTLTVKCGTTTKLGPYYFGANSGLTLESSTFNPDPVVKCALNEALNITKGVAGTNVTVSGNYQLIKR